MSMLFTNPNLSITIHCTRSLEASSEFSVRLTNDTVKIFAITWMLTIIPLKYSEVIWEKKLEKKEKRKTNKQEKIESATVTKAQSIDQEALKKLIDSSNVDKQYERILGILDVQTEEEAIVNEENLKKYLMYLRKEIEMPCIVTGIQDLGCFGWEEYYTFGPGNRRKYEQLKIKYPSFRDEYLLLEFDDDLDEEEGLYAHVQRISDKKKFRLTLADLKAVDKKTNNAQLLDDHAVWHTNFRY